MLTTPKPGLLRTLVTIPSRKGNGQILQTFADLNKNINTEKWVIAHRRYKGAVKTTLYLRMDREAFQIIESQGRELKWILDKVEVTLENRKPKPRKRQTSSASEGKPPIEKPNSKPSNQ